MAEVRVLPKDICIDNGGTLTDVCVFDGAVVHATKTLTTPFDLSQCFFDGLAKAARALYGEDDVERLLRETGTLRYSTTQGTNALVERKGPRLGLVLGGPETVTLTPDTRHRALFASLVGSRCVNLPVEPGPGLDESAVIAAANTLAEQSVSRILVAFAGDDYARREQEFISHYETRFPPHNLGTVPIAVAHEASGDADPARRIWTALLNAFLHPPMESFLFNTQKRLRNYRSGAPFRIYRNDGGAAKVAKTAAIRTYSSGPRGGLAAVEETALRRAYRHVIAVDVGGTTSDISVVRDGAVPVELRGPIEGIATSLELCSIASLGIGGGSVIRVEAGTIRVGPDSVGAAPGPACFGLGGTHATITDAFVARGLIDPDSFRSIGRPLDRARAEAAIAREIAAPLSIEPAAAAVAISERWIAHLAAGIRAHEAPEADTVLMAFGGAGPLAICEVASALGVERVFVPRLAALFSAWGVRHAHLGQDYELTLAGLSLPDREAAVARLFGQAARDMASEGIALEACTITARLLTAEEVLAVDPKAIASWPEHAASLQLRVVAPVHTFERDREESLPPTRPAQASDVRTVIDADGRTRPLPVFHHLALEPGMQAEGPAIVQSEYFMCHLTPGWRLSVQGAGDLLFETAARVGREVE